MADAPTSHELTVTLPAETAAWLVATFGDDDVAAIIQRICETMYVASLPCEEDIPTPTREAVEEAIRHGEERLQRAADNREKQRRRTRTRNVIIG